jgi:hypothetical protein
MTASGERKFNTFFYTTVVAYGYNRPFLPRKSSIVIGKNRDNACGLMNARSLLLSKHGVIWSEKTPAI